MKGIILAGGAGTRLWPCTSVISKQLLTVYDKPMVYYPLSVLMLAGIKDILIISTPEDIDKFKAVLGSGEALGLKFTYKVQEKPKGIAEAFIVGEDFIQNEPVCLILGDNIFYGHGLPGILQEVASKDEGATVFAYWVQDPQRYGVVEFDEQGKALGIEEKPEKPKTNYAVPGIYFYDNKVVDFAKNLQPSARGELEITDLNLSYLAENKLSVEIFGRGIAWLDTGTPDSLLEAASFVATIERRQGLKIACIEEIAYRMGYISEDELQDIIISLPKSNYRDYLEKLFM